MARTFGSRSRTTTLAINQVRILELIKQFDLWIYKSTSTVDFDFTKSESSLLKNHSSASTTYSLFTGRVRNEYT